MKLKEYTLIGFPVEEDKEIMEGPFIALLQCDDCGALIRKNESSCKLHAQWHLENDKEMQP